MTEPSPQTPGQTQESETLRHIAQADPSTSYASVTVSLVPNGQPEQLGTQVKIFLSERVDQRDEQEVSNILLGLSMVLQDVADDLRADTAATAAEMVAKVTP